jgi:hypothetical protein
MRDVKTRIRSRRTCVTIISAAVSFWITACGVPMSTHAVWADELPVNVAPLARVSASSHFNDAYRPEMAITGTLPSISQTQGSDWAVRGTSNGWFELRWAEPVQAGQILYYARMASPLVECFKDYEVYLNDSREPVVRGTLEHRHGPQRIEFPAQAVTKIRIEFLSVHPTSPNPGAAAIAVFAAPVTDDQLAEMRCRRKKRLPRPSPAQICSRDVSASARCCWSIASRWISPTSMCITSRASGPAAGCTSSGPRRDGGELTRIFDAGEGMITTADLSYDGARSSSPGAAAGTSPRTPWRTSRTSRNTPMSRTTTRSSASISTAAV